MNDTPAGLFLPFLGDAVPRGPHLRVSVADGPTRDVMVDTGSQGIVLPMEAIGGDATVMPQPTPPNPEYSSSGNKYEGTWKLATVQVTGRDGATFTTSRPVPVFGATCMNGSAVTLDSGLGMMGVGIRGLDRDAGNTMNAFLNLPQMATGEFRTGYILSRFGAWFGYPDRVAGDFQTFPTNCAFHDPQLTPTARVTLTPAGPGVAAYVHLGPFLMDTGLGEMILTTPRDQPPPDAGFRGQDDNLARGVDVALALQDGSGTWRTLWEFNSSQCGVQPDAPDYVRLVTPTLEKPPADPYGMSNTGRHLLALFDYLADLEFSPTGASGRVGLRRRPPA